MKVENGNPYLAAYFTLSILPHALHVAKNRHSTETGDKIISMNFNEFLEALEKGEVVNSNNLRKVPKGMQHHLDTQMRLGNRSTSQQVKEIVEKAYQLGLVDHSDELEEIAEPRYSTNKRTGDEKEFDIMEVILNLQYREFMQEREQWHVLNRQNVLEKYI